LGTGGRISGVGGLDNAGLDDNERLADGGVVGGGFLSSAPAVSIGDSERVRWRPGVVDVESAVGDNDLDRRCVAAAGDDERDLTPGLEDLVDNLADELRRLRCLFTALSPSDFSLSLSDDDSDDDDEEDEDEDDDLELGWSYLLSFSSSLLSSSSSSDDSTAELLLLLLLLLLLPLVALVFLLLARSSLSLALSLLSSSLSL
jgi:hypothetical protein